MTATAFVQAWPSLGKQVVCEPTPHNRHIFDWFVDSLPLTAVQLHTLVAAHTLYLLDLGFKTAAPWREEDVVREVVSGTPLGRISLFMAAGRVGGMGSKYGSITENMRYPTFAQVREQDLPTLAEVGEIVWNNLLGPKAIILVELRYDRS